MSTVAEETRDRRASELRLLPVELADAVTGAAILIEIASKLDVNVIYAPTKERMRGRWVAAHHAHMDAHESLKAIHQRAPIIPGEMLLIDPAAKIFAYFDPLSHTEMGREVWSQIESIVRDNEAHYGLMAPRKKITIQGNLSNDDIKDHLYWLRRMVDGGTAEVVNGSAQLPSLQFIVEKVPGSRHADPFNTGGKKDKQRADVALTPDEQAEKEKNEVEKAREVLRRYEQNQGRNQGKGKGGEQDKSS